MTPSDIADECDVLSQLEGAWYADVGRKTGERCCSAMSQAATTIRAQAEALKIATEALEEIKIKAEFNGRVNLCMTSEMITDDAAQALARIKEV